MKYIALFLFLVCAFTASAQDKAEELQGTILKKEWTKTTQSYCASGSDYYALKTENEEIVLENNSKTPNKTKFDKWVGKKVIVKGVKIEKVIKNDNPLSQKPISFSPDGKQSNDDFSCLVFRVRTIRQR